MVACAEPPPSPDQAAEEGTTRQALSSTTVKYGADDLGTGWYDNQPGLSPQTVAGPTFGQLFRASVSGQVYAQPLVAAGTLLVVTEGNNVYGLDPDTGAERWSRNVGVPFRASDIGCGDLTPDLGITGTPVIDSATNIAYFVAKSYVTGSSGPVRWQMHAVAVATGAEAPGFPRTIAGTASNDPATTFDAFHHMQRPGLLLMNGVVYAAFGGHCDIGPWQGWIAAVGTDGNLKSLWTTQAGASRTNGAGIWQSGSGLVSDGANRIFFTTGNGGAISGPRGGNSPPGTLGEAVVRVDVQPDGTLQANDFFMPFNARTALDPADVDFGSGGPTALPAPFFGTPQFPHLMAVAGKEGFVYLLDRDNLGGVANGAGGSDNVVSRVGPNGGVWSKPSVWPGDGGYVYLVTNSGPLFAYHYAVDGGGRPTLAVAGRSTDNFGYTSGAPVVTSNGTATGTGLVWLLWSSGSGGGGAQLRAYDVLPDGAGHMVERFRAPIGTASKFAAPGVGNGRIYVGTRDGAVYGFGAPIAPVLSAPATDFGAVVVGASASKTITVTAQRATTVTAVGTTGAAFVAGTITPALPATLAAGATLSVTVTFRPTATGLVGGTLDLTTASGVTQFALSGTGQTSTAQLVANKPIVSFGGTAVGGVLTGAITFSNAGSQSLTISGATLPAAPFSATGLPAAGAVLAPGAAVTISVSFAPTAIGTYADAVTLRSSGGDVTVALSGNALSAGQLVISSVALDAGEVALGASRTLSFTLTNTGGADVTITKSKPPVLGPFAATTTLNEGTRIAAGQTLTETVRYTPDGLGVDRDVWTLNSDDASGLRDVVLTGDGLDGTPALTGFTLNGSATAAAGAIQLTPAQPTLAGTAFWPHPAPSEGLTVSFDATISGGSGADGLALVLADPTGGATPASLGFTGGGLGYSGIPGVAVALDTFQNGSDPSANFVGIATGGNTDNLIWAATQTNVPDLRAATRHVTVAVRAGTIQVSLDGLVVLSAAVALPPNVLVGFSAGTGGLTNVHTVSNLSLTGFAAHVNFQLAGPAAFGGYASDVGATFGPRGGGQQFGWSGDNTANARTRNDASSPDPRYDTLLHMQKPSLPDARWELAVPNGTYRVHVVSGDPQNFDSVYRINAEATQVLQGTPSSAVRWFDGSATVAVSDGRLTLSNAAGSANNKVCFVDVTLVIP